MKAHTVDGYVHWKDSVGWSHGHQVQPVTIMANDAASAAADIAMLIFVPLPDTTQEATFFACVDCMGLQTFPTVQWVSS